jgi:hypothetical protein
MPGSGRGTVIAALLDDFGDSSRVELGELERLARAAIAAPRGAPIVISDRDRFEAPDAAERAARADFVDQVVTAEVVAAIARRHMVRGDLAAAESLIATIDDGFSLYHEAQLQLACVLHARGELDLADVVDGIGANPFSANLISAAMRVDGVEIAATLARSVKHGGRIAGNVAHELVDRGRSEVARALVLAAWDQIVMIEQADLQALLAGAFARDGRWADAIAMLETQHRAAIPERVVIAAGLRLVVAMALAGVVQPARELRDALRQRLRSAPR